MKRDHTVYIRDILECIRRIEEYSLHKTEDDFKHDHQLQDAVIRRLEIMGEAAKHVPPAVRKKYHEIPWKTIAGLRDILIHEYFGIMLQRIWMVIQTDIPTLKEQLIKIIDLK